MILSSKNRQAELLQTVNSEKVCGITSKIKVLHLKIKVYMKNIALFTH